MPEETAAITPGQRWSCDESRADPETVPEPHEDAIWADRPQFHAVVDEVRDGLVTLTVATTNDHPRTPEFGGKVDIAVERLQEGARWQLVATPSAGEDQEVA